MRCSQRRIACYYPSRPARTEAAPTDTRASPGPLTASGSDFHLDADVDGTLMDFLVPTCHAEHVNHLWSSREPPCLHHPELPWTPGRDGSTEVADATNIGLAVDERDIFGDGNFDTEVFFDFTNSTPTGKDVAARPPLGVPAVPAAPGRLDLAGLHAALETNFSYAMDRIRAAPSNMLLENQTPWCHQLLYGENMPRVMQGKNHWYLHCYLRICHCKRGDSGYLQDDVAN